MLACCVAGEVFNAVKALDETRDDEFVQACMTRRTWVGVRGFAFAWQELVDCLAVNDITAMLHMEDAKFDSMQSLPLSAGKQVCRCVHCVMLALRCVVCVPCRPTSSDSSVPARRRPRRRSPRKGLRTRVRPLFPHDLVLLALRVVLHSQAMMKEAPRPVWSVPS